MSNDINSSLLNIGLYRRLLWTLTCYVSACACGAVQLCEVVKLGAMSLGSANPEPQVLLLHAARDVAGALRDLAAATTAASGKHVAHPDMHRLKHAAKVPPVTLSTDIRTKTARYLSSLNIHSKKI